MRGGETWSRNTSWGFQRLRLPWAPPSGSRWLRSGSGPEACGVEKAVPCFGVVFWGWRDSSHCHWLLSFPLGWKPLFSMFIARQLCKGRRGTVCTMIFLVLSE